MRALNRLLARLLNFTSRRRGDERFAILYIDDRGKGKKGNAIFVRDAQKNDNVWNPLIPEITDNEFYVVDNIADKFLIKTNKDAPNWKVVLVDQKNPADNNWNSVLPEKAEPLEDVGTAGGKIFGRYLKDVTSRAYVYDLTGKLAGKAVLVPSENLVDRIWTDRPAPPVTPIEFLGHNRGQSGPHTLAGLNVLADHRDCVIGIDPHEGS